MVDGQWPIGLLTPCLKFDGNIVCDPGILNTGVDGSGVTGGIFTTAYFHI